ncbi:MAG: alpha/beta hydrolase, partial [Candidatus Phosphoribacter sp.]
PDHAAYAKRVMAGDVLAVMDALGVERFGVVGHDRGGRVAARLAADHPERVSAVLLLDIVPTEAMYVATSRELAESYWHWFFLTQPAPMPERLIEGDPRAYVQGVIGSRYAGLEPFPTVILDHYVDALTGPDAARGICEDYRAAATIDVSHDAADRAARRLIEPKLHVIWGEHGPVGRLFDPLAEWQQVARTVTGAALDCGHYLAEERPNETLAAIRRWMSQPN